MQVLIVKGREMLLITFLSLSVSNCDDFVFSTGKVRCWK